MSGKMLTVVEAWDEIIKRLEDSDRLMQGGLCLETGRLIDEGLTDFLVFKDMDNQIYAELHKRIAADPVHDKAYFFPRGQNRPERIALAKQFRLGALRESITEEEITLTFDKWDGENALFNVEPLEMQLTVIRPRREDDYDDEGHLGWTAAWDGIEFELDDRLDLSDHISDEVNDLLRGHC